MALSAVFQEIVYHYELRDMIRAGWLSPARFTSVKVDVDFSKLALSSGQEPDYVPERLAEVLDTDPINQLLVSVYLNRAADRKSTLIFTVNIRHMHRLANKFREAGIDARMVYSGTPTPERKTLLEDFRCLRFPVLVNCAVLTEGADLPNVDCIIVARPTRSKTLLSQMIGRGLRKSPRTDKTDCLVIDLLGSVERGVIVEPSLEGLDPDQLRNWYTEVSGKTVGENLTPDKSEEEGTQDTSNSVTVSKLTYTDFDSPFRNEPDYKNIGDLYQLTRYSWVACGDGIFVLELLGQGYLRIQPERDEARSMHHLIYLVRKIKYHDPQNAPHQIHAKPQLIGTAQNISEAIRTADAFLNQATKFKKLGLSSSILQSLERRAPWRRSAASEQQIEIITKRLGGSKFEFLVKDLDGLTKGRAANLLTRLNHGLKARLNRQLTEETRMRRIASRKDRSTIKVGRLVDD